MEIPERGDAVADPDRLDQVGHQASEPARLAATRVDQRLERRRAQDQRAAEQRPRRRPLAVENPGPDRVEHRLDQQDQRCLERRNHAEPASHEGVGDGDLEYAQIDDQPPAEGRVAAHRQRERQGHREGDEVARTPPPTAAEPRCRAAHPAQAADREGPEEAARRRQKVASPGVRGGDAGLVVPWKVSPSPTTIATITRRSWRRSRLVQQPGSEQRQVERRGGLEEDRVRRGGEPVGQHEQHERRGVGHADQEDSPGPSRAGPRRRSARSRRRRCPSGGR